MKKVLLIGAAALGIYFLTSGKKKTPTLPSNTTSQPTFFQQYEGKLVIDSNKFWMVIKNGRIYTFTDVKTWGKYAKDNPQHSTPVQVNFPAWEQYATQQIGGVTNLPGY